MWFWKKNFGLKEIKRKKRNAQNFGTFSITENFFLNFQYFFPRKNAYFSLFCGNIISTNFKLIINFFKIYIGKFSKQCPLRRRAHYAILLFSKNREKNLKRIYQCHYQCRNQKKLKTWIFKILLFSSMLSIFENKIDFRQKNIFDQDFWSKNSWQKVSLFPLFL